MRLLAVVTAFLGLFLAVSSDENQLLFVQVVWRHGDRAPTDTYPNDVHQEDAWPNGWGELTELGMLQQYTLGRLLRKRYILGPERFLSERYQAKEVYIRSTDVNRTLISAYANVAGMYPAGQPGKDFPRNGHWPAHWTPIPVHTVPEETDHVGNVLANCPRADELTEELHHSSEWKQMQAENQDFFDYVSQNAGRDYDLGTIYQLADVNYIEALYNMSQPGWFNAETVAKARNLTQKGSEFLYGISKPYVPELTKLRGGSILKALIDKMKQKVHCQNASAASTGLCKWIGPLRYYAYSAHDTTVAALLSTFGDEEEVIRGGLPHYTASVAMELWNVDGVGPAVKMLYHSKFHHNYRVITDLTKGCPKGEELCPLDVFEKHRAKFIPQDIEAECRAKRHFRWLRKQDKDIEPF